MKKGTFHLRNTMRKTRVKLMLPSKLVSHYKKVVL